MHFNVSSIVSGLSDIGQPGPAVSFPPYRALPWKPPLEAFKAPAHYPPDPCMAAEMNRILAEAEGFMKAMFPDMDSSEAEGPQPDDMAGHDRAPRAAGTLAQGPQGSGPDPDEKYEAYLDILDRLPFRRELFTRRLEKSKLDPEEIIPVTQTMSGSPRSGVPFVVHAEKKRIDVCLDNQISPFPLKFATSEREHLQDCPSNKEYFEVFDRYWRRSLAEIARIVSVRLSALDIDLDASNASVYQPVACCRPVRVHVGEGQLGEPDSMIENVSIAGHRGFILYVEQGKPAFSVVFAKDRLEIERVPTEVFQQLAGHQSFIISVEPGKEDYAMTLAEGEIEIERLPPPSQIQELQRASAESWIARRKGSFFSERMLHGLEGGDVRMVRMSETAPLREALDDLSKALLIPWKPVLEEYAYGETKVEAAIHNAREMLVPCYVRNRDELIEKCAVDVISLFTEVGEYFRLAKAALPMKAVGKLNKPASNAFGAMADGGVAPRPKSAGTGRKALEMAGVPGKTLPSVAATLRKPLELIRKFRKGADIPHSLEVRREVMKLDRLIRKNADLTQLICKPTDRCADSLEPVVRVLKGAGYETQSRGMFWWEDVDDFLPENHFIVIARKNGFEYAVDLTAAQYAELGITDAVIDTEQAWAKRFHDAAKQHLVKYKDFSDPVQAKHAFYSGLPHRPDDVIRGAEDAVVLSKPDWYGKGRKFQSVYKYTEPEYGTIERIGRRYFIKAKHSRRNLPGSEPRPQPSPVAKAAAFLGKRGNWNADSGDLAAQAIANSLRRRLEIHYPDRNRLPTRIDPLRSRGEATGNPIQLYYTGNHYDVVVDGRRVPVRGDGDCLFRAVLRGSGQQDTGSNIEHLRSLAAQDLRNHPEDFRDFVT